MTARALIIAVIVAAAPPGRANAAESSGTGRSQGRTAAPRASSAVWFDYLPNVLYDRDSLTATIGVRRPPAVIRSGLALRVILRAADDATICEKSWRIGGASEVTSAAETGAPSRPKRAELHREFDFGALRWKRLVVTLTEKGRVLASTEAVCYGEGEPFPKVVASGERLRDESGRIAVFALRRRTRNEDRSWLLIRRMTGSLSEREVPATVALFGWRPASGKTEAGELGGGKSLAELISAAGTRAKDATARPDPKAAVPVLDLVASVGRKALSVNSRAGVLLLPPGDVDCGTRIGEYRRAVGLALLRIKAAGHSPVVVVGPVNVSAPRRQLAKYVAAASEAAWGHRAGFVDPSPLLVERNFVLDAGNPRALGPDPNADGRRRLAELIVAALRKARPAD